MDNSLKKPVGRPVGSTYGERRQNISNYAQPEQQTQRPRDFYDTHAVKNNFASDAKFMGKKGSPAHNIIEAGQAHSRTKIKDDALISFLNKVASPGDNIAPKTAKNPMNQVVAKPTAKTTKT